MKEIWRKGRERMGRWHDYKNKKGQTGKNKKERRMGGRTKARRWKEKKKKGEDGKRKERWENYKDT